MSSDRPNVVKPSVFYSISLEGCDRMSLTPANHNIHLVALETGDVGAIYTGRDYTFRGNRICSQNGFTLPADSPAWKMGFSTIALDKIGLQENEIRKSMELNR